MKTSCTRSCRCSPDPPCSNGGSPGLYRSKNQGAGKSLEAPHLKAVGAVIRVAGIEVRGVEVQVQAVDTAIDRRRPAEPVVADVNQRARG